MKNILLFTLLAFWCMPAMSRGFNINGEIRNYEGSEIILVINKVHAARDAGAEKLTAAVGNGRFHFEGTVDSPYFASITEEGSNTPLVSFILYNEDINVTIDPENRDITVISGGPQIEQWNRQAELSKSWDARLYPLQDKLRNTDINSEEYKNLRSQAEELIAERNRAYVEFIERYPGSGSSTYLLWRIFSGIPMAEAIEVFDKLDASILADNSHYKFLLPTVTGQKLTAVGRRLPSMAQEDPEGNLVSLDDFRGRYLLIDFWASWCVPCRASNPGMVELYNKFKDRGFTILGISLDRPGDKDKWVEAIEKDGLTWRHISDLKYWDNEISRYFGVNSIPATVLVDPEGIIIARNLLKEELEELLDSLLN